MKIPDQENLSIAGASDAALVGLGARLAEVIAETKLSQAEFARHLGTSQGFVSDLVRGLKKPGADFLFRLRQVFGTSIDWLLTGQGTSHGNVDIDFELLRSIRLHVALARASVISNDATASAILLLVRDSMLNTSLDDTKILNFLEKLPETHGDLELALELYNGHIAIVDAATRHRSLLTAAVAHFEARKPLNKIDSLVRASGAKIQVNVGESQRNAMGDYHEHK